MKTTWKFSRNDKVISGRPRGSEVRKEILAVLEGMPVDGVLEINFRSVETLDVSAADEIIAGLIARVLSGEMGLRRFYTSCLNESVRETITAVLHLRKRNCLEHRDDGGVTALGPINPRHRETLEYVSGKGEVTVGDVARRFWDEPNLTAATNRLNSLAHAGLILRYQEGGGRRGSRYVYRPFLVELEHKGHTPGRKG